MKTTIQLIAATLGILAIASCTAHVDAPGVGVGASTTTTTTDTPHYGASTTTKRTTVTY